MWICVVVWLGGLWWCGVWCGGGVVYGVCEGGCGVVREGEGCQHNVLFTFILTFFFL